MNIINISEQLVPIIAEQLHRSQIQYHEYRSIPESSLKLYFYSEIRSRIRSEDSIALAALDGVGSVKGIVLCEKIHFDSSFLEYECYRISELVVFSSKRESIVTVIQQLLEQMESRLIPMGAPIHISFSLNNNTYNAIDIFNTMVSQKFYYIQTLATFSNYGKTATIEHGKRDDGIIIRPAHKDESDQIEKLAQNSFQFTRFHMDPYFDNDKSSLLLKKSAQNSVLNGFVDIMLVAVDKNRIVGYYSAKNKHLAELNLNMGEAVISAVDADYRGRGIFSTLNIHLLNWFAENTNIAEMGTYLVNYPIHRTWINNQLIMVRGSHQLSKIIT
jgi:hypothetical protein